MKSSPSALRRRNASGQAQKQVYQRFLDEISRLLKMRYGYQELNWLFLTRGGGLSIEEARQILKTSLGPVHISLPESAEEALTLMEVFRNQKRDFQQGFCSDKLSNLSEAACQSGLYERDPYAQANVKRFFEERAQFSPLPEELLQNLHEATQTAQEARSKALEAKDASPFLPALENLICLIRQKAQFTHPDLQPYDSCLDQFQSGLRLSFLQSLVDSLKEPLIALHKKYSQPLQNEEREIQYYCPHPERQIEALTGLARAMGFDFKRGGMDFPEGLQPQTLSLGPDQVRIVLGLGPQFFQNLFGAIHEVGHGLYLQGLDRNRKYQLVTEISSACLHESQALLWEKFICRAPQFFQFLKKKSESYFGNIFDPVDMAAVHRAFHRVTPGLSRLGADDISYLLHIILRFELERDLINGNLGVRNLKEAWNEKMKSYLGIEGPIPDQKGLLQDVHWSYGYFGYFPTYMIALFWSFQIFQRMQTDIPDWGKNLTEGKFKPMTLWLKRNIYQWGSLKKPMELIQDVAGTSPDPMAYIEFLKTKYQVD